jgi:hypothetical protein
VVGAEKGAEIGVEAVGDECERGILKSEVAVGAFSTDKLGA